MATPISSKVVNLLTGSTVLTGTAVAFLKTSKPAGLVTGSVIGGGLVFSSYMLSIYKDPLPAYDVAQLFSGILIMGVAPRFVRTVRSQRTVATSAGI